MSQQKETPPAPTESVDESSIVSTQLSHGAAVLQPTSVSFSSAYQNIPAELQALHQWVCWRSEQVDGRLTKVPYNPITGHRASVTKPASWGKFSEACNAVRTKGMSGIGFVLTNDDPYTGIDIDDKRENPASDHEREIQAAILANVASYTERSPGERWRDAQGNDRGGYHIVVRGRLDTGRDRGHVGLYSSERYLTFTGDVTRAASIVDYQLLLNNMMSRMPARTGVELQDAKSLRSDAEVHETACSARNGNKYQALCACTSCTGDGVHKVHGTYKAMGYPSQSEADLALLSIIAFYTPDNDQVRRIFRSTGLGKRKKAMKDDKYLNTSLTKARANQLTDMDLSFVKADVASWFAKAISAPSPPPYPGPDAEADADNDLPPIEGPKVTDDMRYGLVGEVMEAASSGTEVNPAAAGLSFMTFASAALGREKYVSIGDQQHHPRLYSVHAGRSSRAGKGMALALTKRIRKEVERQRDALNEQSACGIFHDGGLSSREGLAWLIRDASDELSTEGKSIDPGVSDKRVFVLEEELANVLKQAARDGNTLSAALRTAWDGGDIAPATKSNRTRATAPHIAIHACITPYELQKSLDQNNLTNGFANRFLFCWAERIGIVPNPPPTPEQTVKALAGKLLFAIKHARQSGEVAVTNEARALYNAFYFESRRGRGMTEQLRGLLERHPPYAWRLALTFALLDGTDEIDGRHMKAALAWLVYCRDSTKLIFSTPRKEAEVIEARNLGDRIIEQLQHASGLTMDREPLHKLLGKPDKEKLNAALQQLQDAGLLDEVVTPRAGGGRPLRQYRLKGIAPPPPRGGRREDNP